MKNILQVTADVPNMTSVELWFDVMELPAGSFNDLSEFLRIAKPDFPGRALRIIQVLETGGAS